jgi:hypothetical protein
MNEIAKRLGTTNKKEQVERLDNIMKLAELPVFDMLIRFDPRKPQQAAVSLTIIGGDVPFRVLYGMLDETRELLKEQEIQASLEQRAAANNGGDPEPQGPEAV